LLLSLVHSSWFVQVVTTVTADVDNVGAEVVVVGGGGYLRDQISLHDSEISDGMTVELYTT